MSTIGRAPTLPDLCAQNRTPARALFSLARMRRILPCVLLMGYCGLLFIPGLGDRDLTSSHEARAAQNAQMILDEGHWLVPQLFDRHQELQKPPLYYWLVASIAWLLGGPVDAWAVRLPAALSALACVLWLCFLGVKCRRPMAGLLAAIILTTSLHFTWLARVGRIDLPLTLTITVALGSFFLASREGAARLRWQALGYASLGVGLLLKGPIAVVLPAVVAACGFAFGWGPASAKRQASGLWWGVPLMLAIAAPWYIAANVHTDGRLWEVFFWYHNVERGLGGSEALKAHPWWQYLPMASFDLLPWSLLVPVAFVCFWRNPEARSDSAARLGLCWFGAIALFLSCMSFKRADYLLPAYPGMAIFLGVCIERWWMARQGDAETGRQGDKEIGKSVSSPRLPISLSPCLVVALLLYLVGWHVYNSSFVANEDYRPFAHEIRRHTAGPVIFFRAESHPLMFHVGKPVDTILEWENLEWWVYRPRQIYFVMPQACAEQWNHDHPGTLEIVLRAADDLVGKHERTLVVVRSRGR